MEFLREFNFWTVLLRLVLSFLLGGAIGVERERNGHPAGIRTHIIVSLGACLAMMCGVYAIEAAGYSGDPSRIGAQVVSGIGFLGAGTILVTRQRSIRGLTTAAGVWASAVVGLALGIGFYEGALICTLLLMVSLAWLPRLAARIGKTFNIYFEVSDYRNINAVTGAIAQRGIKLVSMSVQPSKTGHPDYLGVEASIRSKYHDDFQELVEIISGVEGVAFAVRND